ncbi:MAG: S41 family peptidase [Chitinophagales bacterium]
MRKKSIKPAHIFLTLFFSSIIFYAFSVDNRLFEISKNIQLYTKLYREVNKYYVDEVEPAGLMRKGIDGMLKSLDPFTNYITEAQIEGYKLDQNSAAANIGVSLKMRDDYVMISEVVEAQPAHKVGLMVGDLITNIDGEDIKGRSVDEVKRVLTGQPNSEVLLKIKRDGKMLPETITATRDKDQSKAVPYYGMLDENTGYIKLKTFLKRGCTKEVIDAFNDLKKNNELETLVFDLRFNGGGLLDEAIKMVNIFVEKNQLVVSTKGKTEAWKKEYKTRENPVDTDIPIVVLVNNRSASASEIFAGSMQDLDRGVVLGQLSYGKGLVQQTKDIGYNSKLKLTVAKYYTPSGRCVQAINYSDRYKNKDGVSKMPDSLRTAFKTKNGRTIYDGSGVEPDILIARPIVPNIVKSLLDNHLILDYATQYRLKNDSIAKAQAFKFTDKDFEDFAKYVSTKSYDYDTKTEKTLERLKISSEKEKYQEAITNTLTALQEKISAEKSKDLQKHKKMIQRLLEQEIVTRYYYQTGEVEIGLDQDDEVAQAIEILKKQDKYDEILAKK